MYTLHGDFGDALNWAFEECADLTEAKRRADEAAAYQRDAKPEDDAAILAVVVCDAEMRLVYVAPVPR